MTFYYVISENISDKVTGNKKHIYKGGYCRTYRDDNDLWGIHGYAKKGVAITQAKRQQAINCRDYKAGDINASIFYVVAKENTDNTAAVVVFSCPKEDQKHE